MLGVRPDTLIEWARKGRLTPWFTPGGVRRYRESEVRRILAGDDPAPGEEGSQMVQDAVRLYEQGWSIRQVADRFGLGYGVMRRILRKRTTLRDRRGART